MIKSHPYKHFHAEIHAIEKSLDPCTQKRLHLAPLKPDSFFYLPLSPDRISMTLPSPVTRVGRSSVFVALIPRLASDTVDAAAAALIPPRMITLDANIESLGGPPAHLHYTPTCRCHLGGRQS